MVFKGDGAIDLRLSEKTRKTEGEDAGEQPDEQAADQEAGDHRDGSVTGKAEQMTAVVNEFVDVHTAEHGRRPLLGADEINRQQAEHTAKDRPWQDFVERNRSRPSGSR